MDNASRGTFRDSVFDGFGASRAHRRQVYCEDGHRHTCSRCRLERDDASFIGNMYTSGDWAEMVSRSYALSFELLAKTGTEIPRARPLKAETLAGATY